MSSLSKKYLYNILDFFNIDLKISGNKLIGRCPIHDGDNRSAFNLWPVSGIWVCRSHNCHAVFGKKYIDFLKALYLSKNSGSTDCTKEELQEFYEKCINGSAPKPTKISKFLVKKEFKPISLDYFLNKLQFPCPFFLKKFPEEVILKYKVAYCSNPVSPMFERSVVPIIENNLVVGYQGRSIHEKCTDCQGYHNPNTICGSYYEGKWKFNKGFSSNSFLFNLENAKTYIKKYGVVFLTESVGNVFRLESFGIKNSLATFGAKFSKNQQDLLINIAPKKIVYLKDRDSAGDTIAELIKKIEWAEVIVPNLPYDDDIASVTEEYFQNKLLKDIIKYNKD